MKHLRNLLWLLFHPGAWKIYRETRDYRQELHDDILERLKDFQGPRPPRYIIKNPKSPQETELELQKMTREILTEKTKLFENFRKLKDKKAKP